MKRLLLVVVCGFAFAGMACDKHIREVREDGKEQGSALAAGEYQEGRGGDRMGSLTREAGDWARSGHD